MLSIILTSGILVSHRSHRFAQILSLQATVLYTSTLTVKKICENLCNLWEKFNIQHLTFNILITVNGFTKLHQAGVSPALFSGFRPGRGKSPSDEMDSKMHPALRAVAEEWIQQEQQGVQSPASILYFLPFGRALIFISDNR